MRKFIYIVLSFILFGTTLLKAQDGVDTTLTDLSISNRLSEYVEPSVFAISGNAGIESELYSTSREIKRRPGFLGRVFVRPTLRFFKNFSISFDLFFSTEGSNARQQLNRFALHPDWTWGKAHIGDFNHKFSDYSLNGINIRGGGVEINPGYFIFEIIGGQSRRAVVGDPYSSIYAQYMGAARIGFGKKRGSFIALNILNARDNISSLDSTIFIPDSSSGKPQIGVSPQENFIVGLNTDIKFINNMFRIKGEFTTSLFTNDQYSEAVKTDKIPSFVNNIFTIRNSTNLDFAYNAELNFNHSGVNANVKYSVINPGYRSLGMVNVISDKRRYGGLLGFRVFSNVLMVQLRYDSQNDNLLKKKVRTTTRETYGVNLTIRPMQSLSFMINLMRNNMNNDAGNDTLKVFNKINSINVNMMYQFIVFNLNNSLSLGYSNQMTENYTYVSSALNKIAINNYIANINTIINSSWSVGPGFTMVVFKSFDGSINSTITGSFRITNRMIRNRWTNTLNLLYSKSEYTNVMQLNFNSDFKLTASDVIKLKVRYSLTDYIDGLYANFWENIASLSFVHRL
ncbi:MAG: hypothetical protein L3J41_15605 [Melioribacteraceae bacterium]|nr:hypothetical protein [Melioribacteraceae bacterium]